ncbi:MAG: STAS domain-containing protein [Planctomycetota bacterium]|nr:STAS domain-containing protein [Planctomycetota bacterium]
MQQIEVSQNGEVTVVQFKSNKYLATDDIQQLGDELFQVVDDGSTQVVLDMSAIDFLSSAALNRLIMLNKKFKDVGGALRLSGLTAEIDKIFTITRLNTLFKIHADVPSALASF